MILCVCSARLCVLCQTLYTELFSYGKERVKFFLSNIDLPMIHKIEDRLKVAVLYPLEIEERV